MIESALRIVNFVIVSALWLLLAVVVGHSQSQTLLPAPINSTIGPPGTNVGCITSTYCVTTSEPTVIGQELVVCITHDKNSPVPWTITDDSGSNSWTMEATTGTTSFTSPGSSNTSIMNIAIAHAVATTNGVIHIQIGFPGGSVGDTYAFGVAQFPSSVSDTLDGAVLASNSNSPSQSPTTSNSHTTTVNGGIAVGCLAGTINTGTTIPTPVGSNMILRNGQIGMQYKNLGAASTYAIDGGAFSGDSNSRVGLLTAVFKPSSFMFTDAALPQAAVGTAYDAQLHTIGGSSAVSYTVLSGGMPLGLSMDSLGHITGTPTGTPATVAVNFKANSGTASVSKTFNMTVGASFGTPALRQSPVTGNFDSPGGFNFPSSVGCGDVILMCLYAADDTHGNESWLMQIDGVNNHYTDTFNSPIYRIPTTPGVHRGPSSCLIYGPTMQSGTDGITPTNNQAASNGLAFVAYDLENVQALVEPGNLFQVNPAVGSTSTTLTVNFNTVVPNQYAFNILSAQDSAATLPTPSGWTNDLAAPGAGFGATSMNSKTFASAGSQSVSSTSTYSGASPQNDSSLVVTLRPSLPQVCPVNPGPRHRTDVK